MPGLCLAVAHVRGVGSGRRGSGGAGPPRGQGAKWQRPRLQRWCPVTPPPAPASSWALQSPPSFQDHTKLILCPLMAAVTYIDEKRDFRTYRLSLLEEHGCCKELASRLRYARTMVDKLLSSRSACNRLKASS